jgi:ribose transport system substrate-binding protein
VDQSRKRTRRWLALLGAAAVMVVAVPVSAQSPSAPAEEVNPYFETGAVAGSGEGLKVGYISLGDQLPFVKLVTDSIAAQAQIAGLELAPCDSQVDPVKSLECGQNLGVQQVQGVINFNLYGDSSPEICEAYGSVPTISIDIHQPPCEVTFFGANNTRAGQIGGIGAGEALKAENDCTYDKIITLESAAAGVVNTDRVQGMLDGFASICGPIDEAKILHQEVGGTTQLALDTFNSLLPTLAPGSITLVLSLNDDMALGALAAAKTAGRETDIRIGAQGADPSAWTEIACNPVWLADAAYFPEAYGKTVVPAIIDILKGNPVPEVLYTPHIAINKDNIREVYPETPACG